MTENGDIQQRLESMSKLISSENENSRSLHDAIKEGDLEAMMRMLEEGTFKDEVDSLGQTALFVAAEKGLLEMVQQLVAGILVIACCLSTVVGTVAE